MKPGPRGTITMSIGSWESEGISSDRSKIWQFPSTAPQGPHALAGDREA